MKEAHFEIALTAYNQRKSTILYLQLRANYARNNARTIK
ncbi:MAG: hypothetical protein CLLPBCKN_008395 [Chroococcidiopsis cubana SAG 39.79]|uniref:Uncharacterized protein n=1 Tax=Chroococcidiopsis thermalis (strain PCC 7203) TaxID=251229 RepID=K9U8Q4_CHRTP|nr:hypothetical protein Chro_5433 [Chroococcidiopsis thermalis PCC 7203]MDZ4878957.1 hypothetical protein [Chroococcidiopsis cubana SAG 39.79]